MNHLPETKPRVLVCNAGTIRVFRVATELHKHGLLQRCATSLHVSDRSFRSLPKGLRNRLMKRLKNRTCDDIEGLVKQYRWPELLHLLIGKLFPSKKPGLIKWRNRKFGQWVTKKLLHDIDIVWSFDTASLEVFKQAKALGIRCILDMSIAHPGYCNQILKKYGQAHGIDVQDEFVDGQALATRAAEIKMADHIVVGSSFVKQSLTDSGYKADNIIINPYGVDADAFENLQRTQNDKPVFLFVGYFGIRKGIYDLLDAWKESEMCQSQATLLLVGGEQPDLKYLEGSLPQGVEILGVLNTDELKRVYQQSDVFVFPSLFEGFAKVVLEAMAAGLPVITTPNACDKTAVLDGENGYWIKPGDRQDLRDKLEQMINEPTCIPVMSTHSAHRARQFSWSDYGKRCVNICQSA